MKKAPDAFSKPISRRAFLLLALLLALGLTGALATDLNRFFPERYKAEPFPGGLLLVEESYEAPFSKNCHKVMSIPPFKADPRVARLFPRYPSRLDLDAGPGGVLNVEMLKDAPSGLAYRAVYRFGQVPEVFVDDEEPDLFSDPKAASTGPKKGE